MLSLYFRHCVTLCVPLYLCLCTFFRIIDISHHLHSLLLFLCTMAATFINIQCANFLSLNVDFLAASSHYHWLLTLSSSESFIEPCHHCRSRLCCPIVIPCCHALTSTASPSRLRAGPFGIFVVLDQAYAWPLIDLSLDSTAVHRWLWLFVTHCVRQRWCRRMTANYCSDGVAMCTYLKDCEKHSRQDSSCRCFPCSSAIDCDAVSHCEAYNSRSHFDSCEFVLCYSV